MARWSGGKEHDSSNAGEEGYDGICAGCKSGERNETRPLRPPFFTMLSQVSRSVD